MITDFSQKKLAEYLEPGLHVLIRFGHGAGDTIMFMPCLDSLRALYPQTHIDLYVESGQEEIWASIADKDAEGYDFVFSLDFPMSEGSALTKPAKCCVDELGIPPVTAVAALPACESPLVAVHFQGTALPGCVSAPDGVAAQIWGEVLSAGKQPLEAHFEHVFHNPVNTRYPFVTASMRQCEARLINLFGLLQRCHAFIGVASGPFVAALSIMPDRTLYIENQHKVSSYTELDIATVNVNDYQEGAVAEWLMTLTG